MADLKFKVLQLNCTPPILLSATNSTQNDFNLKWSYDGVDYSSDIPNANVKITYSLNAGVSFQNYPNLFEFPITEADIIIPSISWENIIFQIYFTTRTCDEASNQITINI